MTFFQLRIMNGEWVRIWNKVVIASLKTLYWHSAQETEENYVNPHDSL